MDFEHCNKKRRIEVVENTALVEVKTDVKQISQNINHLGHMVVSLNNSLKGILDMLEKLQHRQYQMNLEMENMRKELSDLQTHMLDRIPNYDIEQPLSMNEASYIN